MKLSLSICILLSFCMARGDEPKNPCPEEMLPPCSCKSIGFHSSVVTCQNAQNEIDIQKSLIALRSTPIRTMQIFDANLNFLPHDLFKGLKFERLFIAGSSFMSLSDTDTAFEGLEDSLKVLKVDECTLLNGWEWSQIRNLKALEELQTVKAGPLEIDRDIGHISHLNIQKLIFSRDKLSFIHDVAFAPFQNLETLSLKGNEISQLKRTMFPNPANQLSQIIVSNNKIQTFPEDLFVNMPALRSLHLGGNPILTVDKDVFAHIWHQLTMFDITDSLLRCDCRLKWMLSATFPRNTWAECTEPHILKGKKIQSLHPSDLWC